MRYAPYSKNFTQDCSDGNDVQVAKSFSEYKHYPAIFHQDKSPRSDGEGGYPNSPPPMTEIRAGKPEPRGPIKEHLKRHFTPLTTVATPHHRTAGSDGSVSPSNLSISSEGSPDVRSETVTTVKQEFGNNLIDAHSSCEMCNGCGSTILDKYLLKVGHGLSWHVNCLYCSVCNNHMGQDIQEMTCYVKDDQVYCKMCYSREFGVKCSACARTIQSTDWVRRAKNAVFHLACFSCDDCKRQLSTGEEFAMVDCKVVCKTHYLEMVNEKLDVEKTDDNSSDFGFDGSGRNYPPKTKRIRTTFTDEQVEILQANFNLDSNPDGQELERIARLTGLTKRVTQVWFQNSRARQKKYNVKTVSGKNIIKGDTTKTNVTATTIKQDPCERCGVVYCTCLQQGYH